MADQEQEQQQQSNIRQEVNAAQAGIDMDASIAQIPKGKLSYALNAIVQNFDGNAVTYQNEPGNELYITFPSEFILIGKHFIQEDNKHIFFLTNPNTGDCEIGYMENNDGIYHTYISAQCLNFNTQFPILKAVHKITNCSTEIYWTDGYNPRRYLSLDEANIPKIIDPASVLCSPSYLNKIDCNKLNLQPNFQIPNLQVTDIVLGGNLISGTYQFAVQYCDSLGNGYSSYYSITNPTPIFDVNEVTLNFNNNVGKSIIINISNLDASGQWQYFNLAVIKTINDIPSVELVGTYYIDKINKNITYTGQNVTQIKLTINDIFEKFPYYEIAQDVTSVQDILIWDGLTSIDRVNYQSIASKIHLQWETYKIPSTENYSKEVNATNLRGYLRDEVYAFEIVFILKNGKQTDGFHIPGRTPISSDLTTISNTNQDFIGSGTTAPYWKIYNTASVTGTATGDNIGNATPYQYGEFAYWESEELYPCDKTVWGDLSDQPIRHHKFPDVSISPIFESPSFPGASNLVMQNNAVFPIGVKIDIDELKGLIQGSDLTQAQKDNIESFKIVRGDRGTNKSIVAKGILRNVGQYNKQDQSVNANTSDTYYYPNYPFNDINTDVFLNSNNNAWSQISDPYLVIGGDVDSIASYADPNTNKTVLKNILSNTVYEFCALTRPTITYPGTIVPTTKTLVGPANYDLNTYWTGSSCTSYEVTWYDPFTDDNTSSTLKSTYPPDFHGGDRTIRTVVGDEGAPHCSDSTCCVRHRKEESTIQPLNSITSGVGRRSTLNCKTNSPLNGFNSNASKYRQVFNSPETSFGQPFLGDVLKLENVIFGAGRAHSVEVKKNAMYKLLTAEAQQDALKSAFDVAHDDLASVFTCYQAYITIYINGITRKNYAYSYNAIASYNYTKSIPNEQGVKQRPIDHTQYLIPSVESVGETINFNNYQRESSVFIRTKGALDGTITALPFPSNSPNMLSSGIPIVTDVSRITISGCNSCAYPTKQQPITSVCYYASMKNISVSQWGQIYSYDTVDTGFQRNITDSGVYTIFGGDTFISRFAFKTKLPFFIDNRVGAPDDSDIFYDEIGNVAYPAYWHSSRSILSDYVGNGHTFTNLVTHKAVSFDCPNYHIDPATGAIVINASAGSGRTFYDGDFYLFAYGIPSFYCESSINVDLRQAFNNREGDFYPHVNTSIPDDWVQQSFVPIAQDNTYYYNVTYSKQNKENYFSHLPQNWTPSYCFTHYPFRAIYSDPQGIVTQAGVVDNADSKFNNWLVYRAISYFDFPQSYGKLVSLDGIDNKAILARFENKSLLYNTFLTINTSNPQAAYLGNDSLFRSSPPVDYSETDLGYVGTQNKFLLKLPKSQITIDAKRGQIFLLNASQYGQRLANDLTLYSSGVNSFMRANLPFQLLKYFPEADVDNNYNGAGIHGVYDTKYNRFILTKLDYVPLTNAIKYDQINKKYYIIDKFGLRQYISLTDTNYFCNKSFTLSYNLTTNSWTSFHTYLPNFYIAENNFFYSGVSEGTDLIEAKAFVSIPTPSSTTTSSTTTIYVPVRWRIVTNPYESPAEVCSATPITGSLLYTIGDRLTTDFTHFYTDVHFTTPYNGENNWLGILYNGVETPVQINNEGYLIDVNSCNTTTTTSSTTTTTTTPYYVFTVFGNGSGYANSRLCCVATGTNYLSLYSNTQVLTELSILYTDSALTTVFSGFYLWYQLTDGLGNTNAILLTSSGEILNIISCL